MHNRSGVNEILTILKDHDLAKIFFKDRVVFNNSTHSLAKEDWKLVFNALLAAPTNIFLLALPDAHVFIDMHMMRGAYCDLQLLMERILANVDEVQQFFFNGASEAVRRNIVLMFPKLEKVILQPTAQAVVAQMQRYNSMQNIKQFVRIYDLAFYAEHIPGRKTRPRTASKNTYAKLAELTKLDDHDPEVAEQIALDYVSHRLGKLRKGIYRQSVTVGFLIFCKILPSEVVGISPEGDDRYCLANKCK